VTSKRKTPTGTPAENRVPEALPKDPHLRALALVRAAQPRGTAPEGLPRHVEKKLEESERERAVCYTSMEDLTDRAREVAREIEESDELDGVVVELADSSDSLVVAVVRAIDDAT